MPNTKSAKKALRQTSRRRTRNISRQRQIKEVTKEFRKLVSEGKTEEAKALLPKAYKALDKVAKTGLIKKGKANRLKSRLARKLVIRKS
jgi:small subunit ribosomal protein S20